MSTEDELVIWTVYERPSDFPEWPYVVRASLTTSTGIHVTDEAYGFTTLADVRACMSAHGFYCIDRSPEDEPHIVEVWM